MHANGLARSAVTAAALFGFSTEKLRGGDPPPSDALRLNVSPLFVDLELVGFPEIGTTWIVQGSNDLTNWREISVIKPNGEVDLKDKNFELLIFPDSTGFSTPKTADKEFFRVVAKEQG